MRALDAFFGPVTVDANLNSPTTAAIVAILESVTDAVYILDRRWRFAYLNPQAEAMLRCSRAELVGVDIWAAFPEGVGTVFHEEYRRALDTGVTARFEAFYAPFDTWVEVRAYPSAAGLACYCHDITERKRAEAFLAERESRLRTQYEHFPLPTTTWQRRGDDLVLVDCNLAQRAWADPTPLLGCAVREVYRDTPDVIADYERCLTERHTFRRELTHRLVLAGTERRLVVTYVYVAPDMVMVHAEDITDRVAAEVALRAREAMLAEAQRLAHLGSWEYDPETGALAWSDETFRILGLVPGTLTPTVDTLLMQVHPDDRARVEDALRHCADNGGYDVAYRIIRPDGAIRRVHARGEVIATDGQAGRLVGAVHDITEREAAVEALRRSEASLAEAQRLAHVGSWEWDMVRDELHWSDETYRIVGHAPQAFAPTHERLMATVHPDDLELIHSGLAASLAGHPPAGIDHRVVRPDGEVRTVHQRAAIIRDAAGQPIRQVGVMLDITERRALEERLEHQAFHDPLTGLPNRALFRDRLGQALARAGRLGRHTCAVLLLDLDRFKTVNDSLGHATGDQLLIAVAARLGATLREGDTLARLGGDEFVVLLEGVADLPDALAVAGRLHEALAFPVAVETRALFVAASIGVALRSAPGDTAEDLLRFADVALYRAKEAGRSCTEVFYSGMSASAVERLELEHDLRRAVERGELIAHYQPQVDLATGAVVGLEALMRWRHPSRGLVPPSAFIPLAEETGLIVPIGRWVLTEACRQLAAWRACYPDRAAPVMGVNLSARQFRNPDLAREVAAVLAETGLPPDLLNLEVTETAAMAQPAEGTASLYALKALGVRLALDDFGTGYSSLAYLRQLPVDTLKIDRAFFQDEDRNRAIVRAVTDLAHGLGLEVTAEGLETAAQVAWARDAGCDRGQGYYFARPLPAEACEALWAMGLVIDLSANAKLA